MLFHIFAHIKTLKLNAQYSCQLFTDFSFTDTGRAGKQKRSPRLFLLIKTTSRKFNRPNEHIDRFILSKNNSL